jgi:hypothetical protein
MIAEANQAQRFLGAKFGTDPCRIKEGTYAVPCDTSKGKAFMRLLVDENKSMRGFDLFWDESLTVSWYNQSKPGDLPKESKFATIFRKLEAVRD